MVVDIKSASDDNRASALNSNPCNEEGKLSKNCLEKNYYDSDKCLYYFENYRRCLQFWHTVKRLRIKNQIQPFLPDNEEREKILTEKWKGNNVYQVR